MIDQKYERIVVHVMYSISMTSSGYHEFAQYRNDHFEREKNIVLVCGERIVNHGNLYDNNLEIFWGNGNLTKIRKCIAEISKTAKERKTPYIFHIHQPLAGDIFINACKGLSIRNHVIYTMRSTYTGYITDEIRKKCIRTAFFSEKLTFLSYASYKDYPKWIKKWKNGKISVIEHGSDDTLIEQRAWENSIEPEKKIINAVFVARITETKNHRFLLQLIKQLEGFHLFFVGEEKKSDIENLIKEQHLEDKVTITGLKSRKEVYDILQKSDLYLSPSIVEGLPVSVLEAMFAALPIILSDIEPHKEIAQKSKGIKVLALKQELWIHELEKFKKFNNMEKASLGKMNRKAAEQNFTLEKMHKRYTKLYACN